jgi:hypothetical protein
MVGTRLVIDTRVGGVIGSDEGFEEQNSLPKSTSLLPFEILMQLTTDNGLHRRL